MINYKIINILGIILIFLGISMIPSSLWCLYYGEYIDLIAFIKSTLITLSVGAILFIFSKSKRNNHKSDLSAKDGFTVVSIGWIMMALFSSLPYYLTSNYNFTFVDSFFESMSGLTTTGASILGNEIKIEALSHGLLFWRSFTHFIGGMGIIVFSIAILPLLGIGGVQLFRAEVAGPVADKMTPRVKQTAKLLWGIYAGLVLILTIILYIQLLLLSHNSLVHLEQLY